MKLLEHIKDHIQFGLKLNFMIIMESFLIFDGDYLVDIFIN
jgi:hypothetical protein